MTIPLPGLDDVGIQRTARFSPDRRYRYTLERTWDPAGTTALFVMLNPSIADEDREDRTVARCVSFARSWGHGALSVLNLYALVSTDPDGLWEVDDPVGPLNDDTLAAGLRHAAYIVAAWGVNARPDRVARFWEIAHNVRAAGRIHALRVTKDGQPGHPLYIHGTTRPVLLEPPS